MNSTPFTSPSNTAIAVFYTALFVGGMIAVLALIKLLQSLKQGGERAGEAIGDVIADVIVGDPVSVNASVRIPNLGVVPFDVIIAEGSSLRSTGGESFIFTYRGIKYRVVPPRRADGTYDAVRA